jgi:hypothetical protein
MNTQIGRFNINPEWVLTSLLQSETPGNTRFHAVALYQILSLMADRDTHTCFPSRKTLADRMNLSEDSVDRALKLLVLIGAIVKTERINTSNGENYSNLYTIVQVNPTTVTPKPRAKKGEGKMEKKAIVRTQDGVAIVLGPKSQGSNLSSSDLSKIDVASYYGKQIDEQTGEVL